MTVAVEILTSEQAHLLQKIAEDVFDRETVRARLAEYLADTSYCLGVAISDGTVVGQVQGFTHRHLDKAPEFFIENLGVTPSHRRRGIAVQLIKTVMTRAKEFDCEGVWVVTEPDNDPAIALYKKIGLSMKTATMFEGSL